MSYKHNNQDPTRRTRLLTRRNKDHIKHEGYIVNEKDGKFVKFKPGAPAYVKGNTQRMKMSRRLAMMRWIIRNTPERLKEEGLVSSIRNGMATRHDGYGFHPTKGGSNHGRAKNTAA